MLKTADPMFCEGWLYDSIIDAYLLCLKEESGKCVQILTSSVMTILQHELSSKRIWRGEDLSTVHWIFAPWNPTNNHWTLKAVNVKKRLIFYLNPMECVDPNKNLFTGTLNKFFIPFLSRFGWSDFTFMSPDHYLQRDSSSCGVFVCMYAKRLLRDVCLADKVNSRLMRLDIFEKLRGNCLQRYFIPRVKLSVCPICFIIDTSPMVACTKCKQWYHCSCLDVTEEEARARPVLHCPSLI